MAIVKAKKKQLLAFEDYYIMRGNVDMNHEAIIKALSKKYKKSTHTVMSWYSKLDWVLQSTRPDEQLRKALQTNATKTLESIMLDMRPKLESLLTKGYNDVIKATDKGGATMSIQSFLSVAQQLLLVYGFNPFKPETLPPGLAGHGSGQKIDWHNLSTDERLKTLKILEAEVIDAIPKNGDRKKLY